jgi:hypothetical protein
MGSAANVKPGIRGQSLLKEGEDIATLPGSLSPEQLIDAQLTKLGVGVTFAANWFEKKKPHTYRAICSCLAHSYPIRQIAHIFKVSPDTVCAIAERECNNLPPAKETILSKTKVAARLAVERVTDEIQAMSGKDAAIAYGILTDKMLLLSGEANVVIAKQREAPTHQDFNAMIEALPTASVREIDTQPIARATLPPVVDETPAPLTVSQTTPQQ